MLVVTRMQWMAGQPARLAQAWKQAGARAGQRDARLGTAKGKAWQGRPSLPMSACSKCNSVMCASASSSLLVPSFRAASSSSAYISRGRYGQWRDEPAERASAKCRIAPAPVPQAAPVRQHGAGQPALNGPCCCHAHRDLPQAKHGPKGVQESPGGEQRSPLLLAHPRRQGRLQRRQHVGGGELRAARQRGTAGRRLVSLFQVQVGGQAAGRGRVVAGSSVSACMGGSRMHGWLKGGEDCPPCGIHADWLGGRGHLCRSRDAAHRHTSPSRRLAQRRGRRPASAGFVPRRRVNPRLSRR